jgi:hypothetical protein
VTLLIFALGVLAAIVSESAHADSREPSASHTEVPIWPGAVPDPHPVGGSEVTTTVEDKLVAGRPWLYVERVSQPTMTVYPPEGTNTGVAVVIFPGAGFKGLAIAAHAFTHWTRADGGRQRASRISAATKYLGGAWF